MQVCSAVQNQDFTLIDDYISGLKALLYLQSISEMKSSWKGQSPPTPKHQLGKPVVDVGKRLPNFGPYKKEKEELISKQKITQDLLADDLKPSRVINKPDTKISQVKVCF